jgi:hypothetical protein
MHLAFSFSKGLIFSDRAGSYPCGVTYVTLLKGLPASLAREYKTRVEVFK